MTLFINEFRVAIFEVEYKYTLTFGYIKQYSDSNEMYIIPEKEKSSHTKYKYISNKNIDHYFAHDTIQVRGMFEWVFPQ